MEMLSQRQVTFFLLVCFSAILVNDAANTSTSCPEVAYLGQPVNITCDITGVYETIGFSRPDNLEVATCLANDKCYVNDDNYGIVFRSPEKHILRIKKFAKKDIGMWNCRDGTDPLLKTCRVDGYDAAITSTSCPEVAYLDQPVNITCDITGVYETIGFSRPDNLEVATCLANDKCYVNDDNYEIVFRSPGKHILRIKKFSKKDIGMWICRDGTDPPLKTCRVDGYDAAITSTSCPEVACLGQPVNITCDITGVYETIGFSRPDNLEVATCLANDRCYVNEDNYEIVFRSPEKHILRIKKFAKKDIGMWNCRDGTDPLLKICRVDGYDVKQSPTPTTLGCISLNKAGFRPSTLCRGFEEDPNVNITIWVANLPFTFTYDQYNQNDIVTLPYIPKGEGGVECRVTGPASQCYTISKPYKNEICPAPGPTLPSPWIFYGIGFAVLLVLVPVVLVVDCVCFRPRDKGATHLEKVKLFSRNAYPSTEEYI